MAQFDFGTIDPYVVDGVQLAGMLNQWRDAIHSWHRGPTRPAYVVPGMMWINDSAGAANWVVNVFMGASIGDVPLFTYNTTTGAIGVAPGSGGFTANLITAQGSTPTLAFNDIDNPIDQKRWQWTIDPVGALVLSSVTDAGAVVQSFTFNRDGTTAIQAGVMRLYSETKLASPANELIVGCPVGARQVQLVIDACLTGAAADNIQIVARNAGGNITGTGYSYQSIIGQNTVAAGITNAFGGASLWGSAVRMTGTMVGSLAPGVDNNIIMFSGTFASTRPSDRLTYAVGWDWSLSGLRNTVNGVRVYSASAINFLVGSSLRCYAIP